MLSHFSCVWLFATPWTAAHQALLSREFHRQEYWSGMPFLPPGDLPDPGIEPMSLMLLALEGGFFLPLAPPEKNWDVSTNQETGTNEPIWTEKYGQDASCWTECPTVIIFISGRSDPQVYFVHCSPFLVAQHGKDSTWSFGSPCGKWAPGYTISTRPQNTVGRSNFWKENQGVVRKR